MTLNREKPVQFFSSGSTLLDLALGGGWALGRIFNIVGDKSTGKTLLAIEAFANFIRKFPNGKMRYAEAEAAFDEAFAATLGFPSTVERPDDMIDTVEDFRDDLKKFSDKYKAFPTLYILDSLDALTDDAELKKYEKGLQPKKTNAEGEEEKVAGSFGVAKPKELSKMFRIMTRDLEDRNHTLGIISQIRDNIGVTFGETKTRSGGHALDFYAAQVLWLAQTGQQTKTIRGEERSTGVNIQGKVKKNKVGMPFRKADFGIIFGYGVDDESSMLKWLTKQKMEEEVVKETKKRLEAARDKADYATIDVIRQPLIADTTRIWNELEKDFAPTIQKYPVAEIKPRAVELPK